MSKAFENSGQVFLRRMGGIAVLAAYVPTYFALIAILPTIARNLLSHGSFFGFAVFTAASYSLVSLALLTVAVSVFVPTWKQRAVSRCKLGLALYWLPHALVIGFWCVMIDKTAWID